ncbi:hypothetical protein [uncultured Bacteroides sp.]|uniref:hypothetical protein n=1 Tax=uncultured Bacteroides sp. TaxID=162156 RepID=UPI002AA63EF1|nr:hypothetical protein [uncultured Bacteroides sp.]
MEKVKSFTHVYGYIICIVSVVVFLTCVTSLVNAVINKTDPLQSYFDSQNLATFEVYKLEQMKSFSKKDNEPGRELPNDQTLRKIYEDTKKAKIDRMVFDSNKTIIVSSTLIVISIILFWTHWNIARKNIIKKEE